MFDFTDIGKIPVSVFVSGIMSKTKIELIEKQNIDYDRLSADISDSIKEFFRLHYGDGEEVKTREIVKTVPHNVFQAGLKYAHDRVIKDKIPLRNGVGGYNGGLDIDIADRIADIYIAICEAYNKLPSESGFARIVGCDTVAVMQWRLKKGSAELSSRKRWHVYNKIKVSRQAGIMGRLSDGGAGTMAATVLYNNEVLTDGGGSDFSGIQYGIAELPRFGLPDHKNGGTSD